MSTGNDDRNRQGEINHIRTVLKKHQQDLLSKANVTGVAIGFRQIAGTPTDTLALVVMVDHKLPKESLAPEDQIPSTLEGIPIDVQEVGKLIVH